MRKRALITGVTGMDGAYLSRHLLNLGYIVYGMRRRQSKPNTSKLTSIGALGHPNFMLVEGDMQDSGSLGYLLQKFRPDEVYNLAAQSHVGTSFVMPEVTFDIVATGVIRLLDAVRQADPTIRVYQAASSEMFGAAPAPQDETTVFYPRSPYAVAKCAAFWAMRNYRESYGMFCCNGILFNHEGVYRGEEFVTKKITKAAAKIRVALDLGETPEKLALGTLDAKRDWGHALDYVRAMRLMMEQHNPDDYVIATGESHTVEEFVKEAFDAVNLDWRMWVYQDPKFVRPCEVPELRGNATKAKSKLGWEPTTRFKDLIRLMVEWDTKVAKGDANE